MNIIQELHQFEEGLRPLQPSAAHDWDGKAWVLDSARGSQLDQQEAEGLCVRVDAAADSARAALAGDPLKALEYARAAVDAQSFQDAGYPRNDVPLSVAAWVARGRSARQAADQILDRATRLSNSLLTLRTLRLKAKTRIRTLATNSQMDQARAAADEALQAIRDLIANRAP